MGKKIHGPPVFLLSSLLVAASALGAADPPSSASELPADPELLLRARANHFPLVTLGEKSGIPEPVEVNLGQILVPIPHRGSAVAVRIRTPKAPLQDFAWAFSAPKDWQPFYFGANEGTKMDSLSWLEADRAYGNLPAGTGSIVRLQSFPARSLQPDQEYLLGLVTPLTSPKPFTLKARVTFTAEKRSHFAEYWHWEAFEKELQLLPGTPQEDVAVLKSRGGQILLDPHLFPTAFGQEKVGAMIASIREEKIHPPSGHPLPDRPVLHGPNLASITQSHGAPDLVLSARDISAIQPMTKGRTDTVAVSVAWYDYVGFFFQPEDPARTVVAVEVQGCDLSLYQPRQDGLVWSAVPSPSFPLTVYFKDRMEIARIANLGTSEARLLSGSLVKGQYSRAISPRYTENLTYLGDGNWDYMMLDPHGKVTRTMHYKNHARHGVMKDFNPDGTVNGVLWFDRGEVAPAPEAPP